jgi:hypothetical protein
MGMHQRRKDKERRRIMREKDNKNIRIREDRLCGYCTIELIILSSSIHFTKAYH